MVIGNICVRWMRYSFKWVVPKCIPVAKRSCGFVRRDFTCHYIAGIRFRKQKEITNDLPREAAMPLHRQGTSAYRTRSVNTVGNNLLATHILSLIYIPLILGACAWCVGVFRERPRVDECVKQPAIKRIIPRAEYDNFLLAESFFTARAFRADDPETSCRSVTHQARSDKNQPAY